MHTPEKIADLHVHSIFSDGSDHPLTICKKAKQAGLEFVCLTDHDCIEGIVPMLAGALHSEIAIMSGVEIYTFFQKIKVEILGYGFHVDAQTITPEFKKMMLKQQRAHNDHIKKIIALYNQAGYFQEDFNTIKKQLGLPGPTLMRLWLRQFRVNKKNDGLTVEQTRKEIQADGIAYVPETPADFVTPQQAIEIIHGNNGLAFWAHPWLVYKNVSPEQFLKILALLISAGLNGLEARHPSHPAWFVGFLENLARQYNLLISGGSDCHGRFKSEKYDLGKCGITRKELEKIQKALS